MSLATLLGFPTQKKTIFHWKVHFSAVCSGGCARIMSVKTFIPATEPQAPQGVEGVFEEVSEGFLKGPPSQPRNPSKRRQEPFENLSRRAKGTLISEPRFSTPCEMRFFPREKGKTAFVKGNPSTKAVFPFSRGKNRISQGVENRGSLISVPLALREVFKKASKSMMR